MKRRINAILVLSWILIIAIHADAEVRIDPDGVTFPDSSTQTTAASGGGVTAPLHLSGSFATTDSNNPDGAVISGENTNTGDNYWTHLI